MRSFDLVIDRFADVVEETRCLADVDISADFRGKCGRDDRTLQGVGEHILSIAGAELEAAQQLDQVWVEANYVGLVGDTLAAKAVPVSEAE